MSKRVEETSRIILAARENRFIAPQTVLVSPGGRRFRLLLYAARVQGDGRYCCEFLAIDEVSGPAIGMSSQLSSLLTSIRMAFRFRSELIQRFPNSLDEFSEEERSARIEEITRIISNLSNKLLIVSVGTSCRSGPVPARLCSRHASCWSIGCDHFARLSWRGRGS
jgi:hypothetical protein